MRARGEHHHRVEIPNWKVREMRRLNAILGYKLIGWIYDVSMWTVRDICTYRTRIDA